MYKYIRYTKSQIAAKEAMKDRINSHHSRYAQIINNTNLLGTGLNDTPEGAYDTLYRQYEEEQFVAVLEQSESLINQFSGDEIVSKFEF
jgi:hypothetical protein